MVEGPDPERVKPRAKRPDPAEFAKDAHRLLIAESHRDLGRVHPGPCQPPPETLSLQSWSDGKVNEPGGSVLMIAKSNRKRNSARMSDSPRAVHHQEWKRAGAE